MVTAIELGYDFGRIRTARLMQQNQVSVLLGLIFLVSFAPIAIVFLVLYLFQVPMEINSTLAYPGEQEYERFFLIFLLSMGLPSLISLMMIAIGISAKPKPYVYLGLSQDYDPVVYAVTRKSHIYIDKERVLTLDLASGKVRKDTNPASIENTMLDYCFFKSLEAIHNPKIKRKSNHLTLSFNQKSGRVAERRRYRISFNESGEPWKIREMIYLSAYGNNNLRSFKSILIDSVNQNLKIPFDHRIQNEILSI